MLSMTVTVGRSIGWLGVGFQLKHITGSTADTFLEYIQRNLPEGMCMKVTKVSICRYSSRALYHYGT